MIALFAAAHADCPTPVSAVDLRARAATMVGLLEEDLGAVLRARAQEQELLEDVPCLRDVLSVADATELLYARGLVLFFAGELPTAEAHFAAVKALDPVRAPPRSLAPHEGHPLAVRWAAARANGAEAALDRTAGQWFVDGEPSGAAPADVPYLLQRIGTDGAVAESRWVVPGPRPAAPRPRWQTPTGLALAGAGGATALVIGAQLDAWCTRPDRDGDGFADCGAPLVGAFWGGVGAAAAGAALAITGVLGGDDAPVAVGPMPGAAGLCVYGTWGGHR